MTDYATFLGKKRITAPAVGIEPCLPVNPMLFGFQRDIVSWALRRGRAAIWADCGLGKTPMALEWARHVQAHTNGRVLILTPLAVAAQFVREGEKFGVNVTHARDESDLSDGVNVTNYERLHRFDLSQFAGVVADESSILKDYTSKTRNAIIDGFRETPYRLACTATPAPNDFVELGNHAEFLGVMSRVEMLSMFFVHDGGSTQDWRLKGHARNDYWRWLASWAVALKRPGDLGYCNDGYDLPPLRTHERVVSGGTGPADGMLFQDEARTLSEQRKARRASLSDRVRMAAEIVNAEPDEPWLVWCDMNDESAELTKAINDAVEVKGSDSPEHKEKSIHGFGTGDVRVLVSKPSIAGWGVNWQHCARVVFVGLSHSFEAYYQAIRRTWRFGQTRPVECYVVTGEQEGAVVKNLRRKQEDAETLASSLTDHMSDLSKSQLSATVRTVDEYNPTLVMRVPEWIGVEE
jgi:superfamily II DNA or RNA helicase